jgi:hypothetical protein
VPASPPGCQQEFNARLRADIDDDLGKAPVGGRELEIYQWQRDDEYRRRGKLLEKRYRVRQQSSREFFADFCLSLRNAINRHRRLHGRHIDFRAFDRIGPYIDWRGLLKSSVTK